MYASAKYLEVHGNRAECVLSLIGEIDMAAVCAVSRASVTAISASPAPSISVNLGAVTFIDAAGLSLLVQLRDTASLSGKTLHLKRVSPRLARVLALGGLTSAFPVPDVTSHDQHASTTSSVGP